MERIEIEDADVWAVACGGWDRDYLEDVFLKYGVALVGCYGVEQAWSEQLEQSPEFKDLGRNTKTSIRTVACRVKKGDILIAKQGRRNALAVGRVVEAGQFRREWAEIQGWDLYHQVRVVWVEAEQRFNDGPCPFMVSAAHHVNNTEAADWAREVFASSEMGSRDLGSLATELPELPADEDELPRDEIPDWFADRQKTAEDLLEQWGWGGISENSALVHIVVPMLLDLGWRRDQIRLEYHWIDIAVLDNARRDPVLLIEAKAPRFGVRAALNQVRKYRSEGELSEKWQAKGIPVLATSGLSFILQDADDSRHEAFLRHPTTKAIEFFRALERIAPESV
jgi:hypothetical protein